jgi:hypothetical protein
MVKLVDPLRLCCTGGGHPECQRVDEVVRDGQLRRDPQLEPGLELRMKSTAFAARRNIIGSRCKEKNPTRNIFSQNFAAFLLLWLLCALFSIFFYSVSL